MSFDLSRVTFDPFKDFLGVVRQQGRVQLDADWNELVTQLIRRIEVGTLDILGSQAVPCQTPDGFQIGVEKGDLSIGVGRIYVDGVLAENHGAPPHAWDCRLAEAVGTKPTLYSSQPYFPDPPPIPSGGPYLVYLDVWQRDVTHLQDPSLLETALGGVDTCGRLQTVWQVKLLGGVGEAAASTPSEDIPGWADATRPTAGRLSTATSSSTPKGVPGVISPAAGYTGMENQLYRVEIHTGGERAQATFKWARDNGSIAGRVSHINGQQITIDNMSDDEASRFEEGDWVEITDDWRELHNRPGDLRRIDSVNDASCTITLQECLTPGRFPVDQQGETDSSRHTRIRRWNQAGQVLKEDGSVYCDLDVGGSGEIPVPEEGTRVFLEHGIVVELHLAAQGDGTPGEFRSGDYWVFAARAASGSIEVLDREPPRGVHHHYARLALLSGERCQADLRTLWCPDHRRGGDPSALTAIEGVPTSVAGFVGQAERGPTAPQMLESWAAFQKLYGGPIPESYLAHAVCGFFDNGGERCWVARVVAGKGGGEATARDYVGDRRLGAEERTGLAALEAVDSIAILCVPDEVRRAPHDLQPVTAAAIEQCERLGDRICIVSTEAGQSDVHALPPRPQSSYAAFYYPWIEIRDPVSRSPVLVPPGGHVAGIYARTDRDRGVHKAPANEVVLGATGLEFPVTTAMQDVLNPQGVNCLRDFPGRGLRVWGARTLSGDPEWKYVNVRRLFLFLEESIDEGTQWAVFEPNDANLWTRVRQAITSFLNTAWRNGALQGSTEAEAFFVRCDHTTMTQDDIDNGRLNALVGVAPVRPAEFIIFRISKQAVPAGP